MNILLISHFFPPHKGGVETASYNTMNFLTKFGHKVIVITSKDDENKINSEEKYESLIYRFKSFYPPEIRSFTQSSSFGFMPKAILKLPKIIRNHNIHLIHVQGRFFPISIFSALLNILIFKRPMVITAQGRLRGGFTEFIERIFDKVITKTIYQKCNKIICVSRSLLSHFLQQQIKRKKLIIIPNGVDINLFTKIESSKVLDKYIKEKKDCKKIIFIGRLDKQKGVEYLIRSIPNVVKKYENLHLFIIGSGHLENELKNLTKTLQIQPYITFIDAIPLDRMPEYYSAADIFCLPSIHEGFPLSIAEALSIGLVIVASNTEGIPDALIEERNGFLVEPGNISQLSEKILIALNLSSQEIETIRGNNIKLARERYSWEVIVKTLSKIYKGCFR
ncbi:MAG: glycosyltransferase family 4 protein [Promethearchaeota archaeon]